MSLHPPEQCQHCSMLFGAESFCAALTEEEFATLSAESSTLVIKRGETIPEETLLHHPVIAISSGVLSLQHLLHDGRRTIAAILMRGDILDLRNSSKAQLGALIALKKVTLCKLPPDIFDASIANNPDARTLAWDNITSQAFRAINHAADLAKKQALEKLASFIFECRNREPGKQPRDSVKIPIRRRDLAEYLGMQPETVSRCFKELVKRDIIQVSGLSVVRIANAPALRRIANGDRQALGIRPEGDHRHRPTFNILVADG